MSYYHDIIMSMKDRVRRPSTCRPHPKIKFSKEEDERLRQVISHFGVQDWDVIADQMPGRNQRQCRERWLNYLSPAVKKEPFSPEEDKLLIEKYKEHGSRWVRIAKYFSGRSDTAIKNRWMALQRKILLEEEEKLAQVYEESGQLPEITNATRTDAKNNRQSRSILKSAATSHSLLPLKIPKHKYHKKTSNGNKVTPSNTLIPNEPINQTLLQPNPQQIYVNNINNSINIFQPQNIGFYPYNPINPLPPIYQPQPPPQQPQPPQINQANQIQQNQTMGSSNQKIQTNKSTHNQVKKQKEPKVFEKDSNVVDENDEVDFWSEVFSSNEFQSNADMFNWY